MSSKYTERDNLLLVSGKFEFQKFIMLKNFTTPRSKKKKNCGKLVMDLLEFQAVLSQFIQSIQTFARHVFCTKSQEICLKIIFVAN